MTEIIDKKGQFQVGTRFIGNVNKVPMQIIAIKDAYEATKHSGVLKASPMVYIRNLDTGKIFRYGLRALEHCDVTIIKGTD